MLSRHSALWHSAKQYMKCDTEHNGSVLLCWVLLCWVVLCWVLWHRYSNVFAQNFRLCKWTLSNKLNILQFFNIIILKNTALCPLIRQTLILSVYGKGYLPMKIAVGCDLFFKIIIWLVTNIITIIINKWIGWGLSCCSKICWGLMTISQLLSSLSIKT